MSAVRDELAAPDAHFVRQRWIPTTRVEWAENANEILLEHGGVCGQTVYTNRWQARWRAQSLIRLLVELRLHERWELKEHTESKHGGWVWSVEYVGGQH